MSLWKYLRSIFYTDSPAITEQINQSILDAIRIMSVKMLSQRAFNSLRVKLEQCQEQDDQTTDQKKDVQSCSKCTKEINYKHCCGEEYFKNWLTGNTKVLTNCYRQVTGKDVVVPEEFHNKIRCIYQCVGQTLKYIDSEGYLIADQYTTFLIEKMSAVGYPESFQNKIIEDILERIKISTENNNISIQECSDCKPAGYLSDLGLPRVFIINCPEDLMRDKDVCKIMQKRIKEQDHCLP